MSDIQTGQPPATPPPSSVPKWVVAALLGAAVVIVGLLAIVILLLIGSGDDSGSPAKDSASEAPKTFDLKGNLTLSDSGTDNIGGGLCQGAGGYSDIAAGGQVVVKNASGTSVAVGALGPGQKDPTYGVFKCTFPFTVTDIPAGGGPYSVEITHRGDIAFTEETADDVEVSLG